MTSSGPTVLLTGATDGLGRALAVRLAEQGCALLLHGRDPDRLAAVARETGATRTFVADLASLAEVARLAAEVRAATDRLDVLVSNAGIGSGEPDGRTRRTSVDGHELRFAVNHLAGFLLIEELLDLLRASAPSRIVLVASLGQAPYDPDDLMLERAYDGGRAYAQSKLAQIATGLELADELAGTGVTVTSLHPGTYMPTKIVLAERGSAVESLETGVDATARLVLDPDLADTTGVFFDRRKPARPHAQARDAAARRWLLERSRELVGPFRHPAPASE